MAIRNLHLLLSGVLLIGCGVEAAAQSCSGSNLALQRPAIASSTYQALTPDKAVDGVEATSWNSGGSLPCWIEIDLGSDIPLTCLRLLPAMTPNGLVSHQITGRTSGGTTVGLASYFGLASTNVWMQWTNLASNTPVRYLRVNTTTNASWTAWYEIQAYSNPAIPIAAPTWGGVKVLFR